jgi:hypothetical protein
MDPFANDEPWKQTIISLQRASRTATDKDASKQQEQAPGATRACALSRTPRSASSMPFSGYIRILERLSNTAVSVSWYDATCGHYADQIWRRMCSRQKTVCTLTGRPVKRGDAVYRPSVRGLRPVNADYLILACVLEGIEAREGTEALDTPSPWHQACTAGH